MAELNVVLIQPQIPQNTGNIARTCAATGAKLHLVGPMGFTVNDKKLKRAGLDYWQYLDIRYYETVMDFFEEHPVEECYFFTTKGQNCHSDIGYPNNSYLVFGREDAGLPEELLVAHPTQCVRLPMRGGLRSLNLSNTVAIGVYEVLRQWNYPELQNSGQLTKFNWEDYYAEDQAFDRLGK